MSIIRIPRDRDLPTKRPRRQWTLLRLAQVLAVTALLLSFSRLALAQAAQTMGTPPPAAIVPAPPLHPVEPPAHSLPKSAGCAPEDVPDPRLWTEHGHMDYTAVRVTTPPKIDGVLDDPVWSVAPIDNRFRNVLSKPYGCKVQDPTAIQVAYDDDNLYVAYRASYGEPGARDDFYPPDDWSLFNTAEFVNVVIDPLHDHENAKAFDVTRVGARAEFDLPHNGVGPNADWRGVWDVKTKIDGDTWYAEFAIPWSTIGLPAHDGDFAIGILFRRDIPRHNVRAHWSLPPPAPGSTPVSFYGHLRLSNVHPRKKLYLQPFVVGRVRSNSFFSQGPPSALRDFSGTNGNVGFYGGFYARYRPIAPLQIDVAANPDFSQVPPDEALANLDRFELVLPETRPFFSEDKAKFEFGTDNAQLFYSRRVGLQAQQPIGATTGGAPTYVEVPIIYAGKASYKQGGTEVSVMNVGLTDANPQRQITMADNITVARFNHFFGASTYVGNILMARSNNYSNYSAGGLDGAISFMNENLVLSGFLAESANTCNLRNTGQGAGDSSVTVVNSINSNCGLGAVGQADVHWDSADYEARLTFLDVSTQFDPELGYFQATGIKSVTAAAGYTPIVNNDFVYEIDLRPQLTEVITQNDALVYSRWNFSALATMMNRAAISVSYLPSTEGVQTPFTIAGGRVKIPAGQYSEQRIQANIASPPGRPFVASLGYTEGDLFYGYERIPQVTLGLNVKHFSGSVLYQLFVLSMGNDQLLIGHQVSSQMTYSYTPLARSSLRIEANTLDPHATVQLVNTLIFGQLSSVNLILERSGSTVDTWTAQSALTSAILSFGYGVSVL